VGDETAADMSGLHTFMISTPALAVCVAVFLNAPHGPADVVNAVFSVHVLYVVDVGSAYRKPMHWFGAALASYMHCAPLNVQLIGDI
jgi:hypothetical protein